MPAIDATLMMQPRCCLSIPASDRFRYKTNAPVRLTSITFFHCSSVFASGRSPHETPGGAGDEDADLPETARSS